MNISIIKQHAVNVRNAKYLQFISNFTEVETGTEMLLFAACKNRVKYKENNGFAKFRITISKYQ